MTFRQRIDGFPEPHRSQMLANIEPRRLDEDCIEEYDSGVVAGAFLWDNSTEGFKYWKGVWQETQKREEGR